MIVTAHISSVTEKKTIEVTKADGRRGTAQVDIGEPKAYPSALGNKLPPRVGRYFNAVLRVRSKGWGAGVKRFIETVSDEELELKNPAPLLVPREIPLNGPTGGLATYFELVKKAAQGPTAGPKENS